MLMVMVPSTNKNKAFVDSTNVMNGTQMNSQMTTSQGTKRNRETWVANNANTAVFIQSK